MAQRILVKRTAFKNGVMKAGHLVICFIVLAVSSCMWGKPDKKNPDIVKDTLAYKYTVFKERAADCGNKADSDCAVVIKFKYPEFKNQKTLNDTISKQLTTMFQVTDKQPKNMLELSKNLMADYDTLKKETNSGMFYSMEGYAKIVRQDSSLTTLEIGGYSFTGGAHPSSYTGFINWNTKANKEISLIDLVTQANLPKLVAIAEVIFRKNEKLSDTSSLADSYFFKDNKFALNDNFSITPTGLKFFYNQYEIKPYAAGTTELIIPYSKIKLLLQPNSVVAQYIK
jgi:hypothetical protein